MPDFAAARRTMVDGQLRTFDIVDQAVLAAMLAVPRERFVPPALADIAYQDTDVAVGGRSRRHLLKPMVLGRMLQAAQLVPTDHVLDVGCATGYSSAVLARLCADVTALEEDADLARQARDILAGVGAGTVSVVEGPLADGWPSRAPYDAIVINGLCDAVPDKLLRQLKTQGRLVAVVGSGPAPKAMLYRSVDGKISERPVFDASGSALASFAQPHTFQF
jgi:protein-L-isoaspartate(D-aspartate) O-methyltransferase